MSPIRPEPRPDRFITPKATLLVDRLMHGLITFGGVAIILAVFGICLFLLTETLPLFRSAKVTAPSHRILVSGVERALAFGMDEWGERPFLLREDGILRILDAEGGAPEDVPLPLDGAAIRAARLLPGSNQLVIATDRGQVLVCSIRTRSNGEEGSARRIIVGIDEDLRVDLPGAATATDIAYGDSGSDKLIGFIGPGTDGDIRTILVPVTQKRGLGGLGKGKLSVGEPIVVPSPDTSPAYRLLIDSHAETIVVVHRSGMIHHLLLKGGRIDDRGTFVPFGDLADQTIASVDWLLGQVSLVLTAPTGENRIFSIYRIDGGEVRRFGQTKTLPGLPEGASAYAMSVRNKAFLLAAGDLLSLRYATTATIRWEARIPKPAEHVAIDGKFNRFATVDATGDVHLFDLVDDHPEAGFESFFGKIHYEGGDGPEWKWQSTGGSDDFEPKISMVPLIWGTLKGTFYAMLFAVPVALLSALYASEFMHPRFKGIVKPVMEIMASLPSVVLGYIAAQVLAPVLEDRVLSLVLAVVLAPLAVAAFGGAWARLPTRQRNRIRPGYEYLAAAPIGLVAGIAAWSIGPWLDQHLFLHINPATGEGVDSIVAWIKALFASPAVGLEARPGDFRLWWTQVTGTNFEQRNSLVVGLIMGFAVIPIIFTIAEDAFSNVPKALRSASLALGATRWQTAIRVVLPTASAGVFSAMMIGLGRAIGETMIVVMATGSTANMDINPFNGMRTLSANIAVELPEAPYLSTLYRTLFLGALILFMMTFAINTLAEIMRQRLRDKYKTI